MAYFPNRLMPITAKEDAPEANGLTSNVRIKAADYNLHDQEIRAIEEYLGVNGKFAGLAIPKETLPDIRFFKPKFPDPTIPDAFLNVNINSTGGTAAVFDVLSQLVDVVNNATDFAGQASSSGYLHSGQKLLFPETIRASFLAAVTPGQTDTTISVTSTEGFPPRGVISILNDVQQANKTSSTGKFFQTVPGGVSTVEWIRYSSKTPTQFLGCERGFLGTTKGPHSGAFNAPRPTSQTRNSRDYCLLLDGIQTEVCTRQFPAWQQRSRYRIPFYGIEGAFTDLVYFIIRFGASFPLNSGYDSATEAIVVQAAKDVGLWQTNNGVPFLRSGSSSLAVKGLLSYGEAYRFVKKLIEVGAAVLAEIPGDASVGLVPVMLGRVAVHYSLAGITKTTNIGNIDAIQIIQTADGRVFCFLVDFYNRDRTLQSVIGYHAYYVAAPQTTLMRLR